MKKNKSNKLNFTKLSIIELNTEKISKIFGGSDSKESKYDNDSITTMIEMTYTQTGPKERFSTNC